MQYRTEIQIATDRYVCLQLPDFIPPGRATVTVTVTHPEADPAGELPPEEAPAAGDFEWWDEFDAEDDPRRG